MATPPTFSAGQVLTSGAMNDVGLWLVLTQNIGSTPVASVTVTDAFSADYDNYLIQITGTQGSGTGDFGLQFTGQTSQYYGNIIYGIPTSTAVFNINLNNTSSFSLLGSVDATGKTAGNITVIAPFLSQNTFLTADYMGGGSNRAYGKFNGFVNSTSSYTDFSIIASTGTLTGGTIRVYGYRNQDTMTNPLIQIDDEVREMTDEETAEYEALIANSPTIPSPDQLRL